MLTETFLWHHGQEVRWSRHGSGPPVVFCHGTPWSATLWQRIAYALSRDFTVYLWDMLGYGTSHMSEGQDVSLAAQGALLVDLLEHWQLVEPHLVAHDYGGAVALRAHLLHCVQYRTLALVDVVAVAPWGSEFFRLVADNTSVFAEIPPRLHEALVRAYITGAAYHRLPDEELEILVGPWLGASGQAAFYRQIQQADQRYTDEIEPLYPTIEIPVLIAWGVEDAWIPVDRAHRLAKVIPGAELHLVHKAGHLVQLDAPEELTATLQRWLLRHTPAP